MKTTFLIIPAFLICSLQLFGQTHIPTGYVSGTWTAASSPYIIDGEIKIFQTDQLIIEPGVDVEFSGHYKFIVHGRLLAEGTETDSIHFYPQDIITGWHGLRFDHTDLNGQDSSKLDYCTFRYGKALTGITWADSTGGGIRCDSSSLLSIRNSKIERNKAAHGGGIYIRYSAIILNHVIVSNNIAEDFDGGGIAFFSSDICIKNSQIFNNKSTERSGGGIKSFSGHNYRFELENVEIFNNTANNEFGGGISCEHSVADLYFRNVNIYNNTAQQGGGLDGNVHSILCEDVNIYNNGAHKGGGIFLFFHSNLLSNIRIFGNSANYGGGIYYFNCNGSQLTSCEIFDNTATHGGAMVAEDSWNMEFHKLTITENNATLGGGVRIVTNSSANISSCIFWENTDDEISDDGTSDFTINYSLISGGYTGIGNIDMDPLFNQPSANDYSLRWDNYPEPDVNKSPCIDSGNPAIPYDPDGTRIDMGAIPYDQSYTPLTAGNINGTLLCSESPYYVYGNLTIPEGEQLIIEPCVHMVFQGQYYLRVEGQLLAQGTESDQITFCAADSATGWSGIRFSGTSSNGQDSSKLENCRLFYGNVGDGGGLYLEYSSDILVKDCHIFNNRASDQGGGIHLFYAAPLLINNIIENNQGKYGGGIYSYVGNYQVHGGAIQNNSAETGGGIYQRGSSPQFHGVTIKDNYASRLGGGLYLLQNCTPVFYPDERCNIFDNYAVVAGTDLYGNFIAGAHPQIYVDTFTVISPDKHFIYPLDEFTLNMLTGKNAQIASDLFVSPTGDDSNSGTSAAEPLQTIYQALKIIFPDPVIERTIHLEPGTYSNSTTYENFPLNMRTNVTLNGGNKILTTFEGDSTTNFFYFYDDQNCKLKNIGFHGGTALNGGALHIDQYSTPVIDSVKFIYNTASGEGGAVFCDEYSDPLISNSSFTSNEAASNGGAMACKGGSSPTINNSFFYFNTGYNGGGLYAKTNAHLSLSNVIFNNNSGRNGGGCWIDYDSNPVFTNVSFVNNEATYGNGGGAYFTYYSDPVLNNCVFRSNMASHGGGGFSIGSFCSMELNNGWITGNVAGYGGGVLGGGNCTLTLRNVEITNNTAISAPYSNDEGGGLYLSDIDVSLINVTISDNLTTTDGGAIYCTQSSNISIQNGILWNNIPDGINIESGTVTAEYSDIQGGYAGTGNINLNPGFYDILTYDYSLGELSSCIDMGTPDTTGLFLPDKCLAGNPRIGNSRIDMGAYEYYDRHQLALNVILEGPYNGVDMDTTLLHENLIPLDQPYNIPPWNYFDVGSVSLMPDSVVDWILVELRHSASYIFLSKFVGFLKYNGQIMNIYGEPISFQTNIPDIYAVIYHRNHLGIMSANPLDKTGDIYSYDFTAGASQTYGTEAQKDLGGGVFGMLSGDANADGAINTDDKTTIWSIEVGNSGYLNGDFNLNSQTDNMDKNEFWIENNGNSSQIPD